MSSSSVQQVSGEAPSEGSELRLLEKVLLKIVMTEDDNLTTVLSNLFVPVLKKLDSPHSSTRTKVVEVLTHINKRMTDETSAISLPLGALVALFKLTTAENSTSGPTLKQFTLLYLAKAFKRAPGQEQWSLLPQLLTRLATRPPQELSKLMQVCLPVFQHAQLPQGIEERKTLFPLTKCAPDVAVFIQHCIPILASPGLPQSDPGSTPAGPCMSEAEWKAAIATIDPPSRENQATVKQGLVEFLCSDILHPNLTLLPLIIGACDWDAKVKAACEDHLKRLAHIDLESDALVFSLMKYYLGEDGRPPASSAIKIRILSYLCKSVSAANQLPRTLQILFDIMFGRDLSMKNQVAMFPFIQWCLIHARDPTIKAMGGLLLDKGFVKLLASLGVKPGSLEFQPGRDSDMMRGFTYSAIGSLSKRVPDIFRENLSLVELLFGCLTVEMPNVKLSVQEGLSHLRPVFRDARIEIKDSLEKMLLDNVEHRDHHVRFMAVQWANDLFERTHVVARYICLLALDDPKPEVLGEAKKGLGLLESQRSYSPIKPDAEEYPTLLSFLTCLGGKWKYRKVQHLDNPYQTFSPAIYEGLFTYVEDVIQCEAQRTGLSRAQVVKNCHYAVPEGSVSPLDDLHSIVSTVLEAHATPSAHASASVTLLNLLSRYPEKFTPIYSGFSSTVKSFILSSGAQVETRISFAKIQAWILPTLNPEERIDLVSSLIDHCAPGHGDLAVSVKVLDRQHGAISALGYVLCRLAWIGVDSLPSRLWSAALFAIYSQMDHRDPVIVCQAVSSLGVAGQVAALTLPEGDSPLLPVLAGTDNKANEPQFAQDSASLTKTLVLARLFALLRSESHKIIERVVVALGLMSLGERNSQHLLTPIFTRLLRVGDFKHQEVQFCVGESLAYIAGAPLAGTALDDLIDVFGEESQEVLDIASSRTDPGHTESCVNRLFDMSRRPLSTNTRGSLCVWLLSMAKYGSPLPAVHSRLPLFQTVFNRFVCDNNEVTQEVASRGLGLLYELGDDSIKAELVKSLVGTLSGTKKVAAVTETADGTGELAKGVEFQAEDSNGRSERRQISTYKELCTIAHEMGKPDLIYKFLEIASTHAMWNSQRGAAFGFSTIASKASDKLAPYLKDLVPKLYRYQYDPNKNVQIAMRQIWESLVSEPKKAIKDNFEAIMKELVRGTRDRQWRVRSASVVALADVLPQRDIDELEPFLLEMWEGVFRLLDDIKDVVRKAALAASRQIGAESIKLCDPSRNGVSRSSRAVSIIVPVLLNSGVMDKAEEVRILSVKFLGDVIKVAGALTRPHAPKLITDLLECMSSLEPQQLSYAQMHTDKINMTAEQLEKARILASRSSPLSEALDVVLTHIDSAQIEAATPGIVALVRQGIGLPTKAGVCHVVNTLCRTHPIDMKPVAARLIKVLAGHLTDRSRTVRRQYSAAISNLARSAPSKALETVITSVIAQYHDFSNEKARHTTPLLLRDLARNASDRLKEFEAVYLPVAYFGSFDWEVETKEIWSEVWSDNPIGNSVGHKLYVNEICQLIEGSFSSNSWKQRAQASRCLENLAQSIKNDLAIHFPHLITIVRNSFAGRTYEGKESLVDAAVALCLACPHQASSSSDGLEAVVALLVESAGKTVSTYRAQALRGLGRLASAFRSTPFIVMAAWPMIQRAIADGATSVQGDADVVMTDREIELNNSEKKEGINLRRAAYKSIGEMWPNTPVPEFLGILPHIVVSLTSALRGEVLALQMVVLKSLRTIVSKLKASLMAMDVPPDSQNQLLEAIAQTASDSPLAPMRVTAYSTLLEVISLLTQTSSGAKAVQAMKESVFTAITRETDTRAQAEASLVSSCLRSLPDTTP